MRHLPIIALVLVLSGCQCFAPVKVMGSLPRGVVIEVEGHANALSRKARLQYIGIYIQDGVGAKPVWEVRGSARINSVTYGKVPRGMVEEVPAVPLEAGRKYSVGIQGDTAGTFLGAPCRGRAEFTVNSAGEIILCAMEETACG